MYYILEENILLSKDILNICYKYAEKYNLHLIRFLRFNGDKITNFEKYTKNKLLYQPEISKQIFYGKNELQQTDYYINNKFIDKKVYINALNVINKYYLSFFMIYMEDQIMNFFIFILAKSFYFLRKIGYYHIKNSMSITMNGDKIMNLRIKYIYFYLAIIVNYTKNTKYEKDIANLLITKIIRTFHTGQHLTLSKLREDLYFYNNVINLCSNSKFIEKENKNILQRFKKDALKKIV